MLTLKYKTKPIKNLTTHLLKKYGEDTIVITDYWDADNLSIGLTDKSEQYTVYISVYRQKDNSFFVSLENPTESDELPYSPSEGFENQTFEEVEKIVVKHLRIS